MGKEVRIVAELHQGNLNRKKFVAVFVFLALICLLGFLPFSPSIWSDFNQARFGEILSVPFFLVVVLVIHEWIHIQSFKRFGKGQAIVRVRVERFFTIVIHQVNDSVRYTRNETLGILLFPFLILTVTLGLLAFLFPYPLLWSVLLLSHTLGSYIDVYVSLELLRYDANVLISFDANEVKLYVHQVL